LSHPGINAVSFASQALGNVTNTNTWMVHGREKAVRIINTDPEYLALMGLELVEGRNLSRERLTDVARSYIINQEAAHFLELPSPVGERIDANFGSSQIIGVVKDFHFNSLHNRIEPLAIAWYEPWANVAQVKISGSEVPSAIEYVGSVWKELCPGFPFVYTFMDEDFARQYIQEQKLAEILKYFVLLAVMLSCLGLFGLAAFIAEDRTKEIGIRKVLGASIPRILMMLSKNFSRWVLLGNIIAWPLAYVVVHQWMKNFPYRTSIGWDIFLMAAGVTLLVALAAVSSQTLRAALANPVESLRWE
jgi:putative ABC transport system permease protein